MTKPQFRMFVEILNVWFKDNKVEASKEAKRDLIEQFNKFYDYYLKKEANV